MKSRILIYQLCFLILSMSVGIASETLNLETFISTVLERNPGVRRIIVQASVAEGELRSSQGIEDFFLNSDVSFAGSEPDQITGLEPDKYDNFGYKISLDKLNVKTGTRYGISYNEQYTNRSPALVNIGSDYHSPSLTLRLTQPLLKNAKGILDSLNMDINELDLNRIKLQTEEELESYLTGLVNLYLNWYLSDRVLSISYEVYQHALEQEKVVKLKFEREIVEKYELLRIQEILEDYHARWLQAKGEYEGLTRKIERQMLLDSRDTYSPDDLSESRILNPDSRDIDYLRTSSRLKGILDNLAEQQDVLIRAKNNEQKAAVDLSLGYTRHGVNEDYYDAHISSLENDDYFVALKYSYPLGNREFSGNYMSQLARQQYIKSDIKQKMIDAEAALAYWMALEKQVYQALESVERKIVLAQKKLEEEEHLYEIGQLNLFELIQDQPSQLQSRLDKERLFVGWLQIKLNIGELLDLNLTSDNIKQVVENNTL